MTSLAIGEGCQKRRGAASGHQAPPHGFVEGMGRSKLASARKALMDADRAALDAVEPYGKSVGGARRRPGPASLATSRRCWPVRRRCSPSGLVRRDGRMARAGARMIAAHLLATAAKNFVKHRVDRTRPRSTGNGKGHQAEARPQAGPRRRPASPPATAPARPRSPAPSPATIPSIAARRSPAPASSRSPRSRAAPITPPTSAPASPSGWRRRKRWMPPLRRHAELVSASIFEPARGWESGP